MTIRKVARLGHPVLRQKAKKIPLEKITSSEIKKLIKDMIETMQEYEGIGLAAPQVHESVQLALIGLDAIETEGRRNSSKSKKPRYTVFINPQIKVLEEKVIGFWEGCLSVPGLRGYVERPSKIQVDFYDEKGKKQRIIAEGFIAIVIQHELDHLQGKLYIDRMKDLTLLAFNEEADRFHQQDDHEDLDDQEDLEDENEGDDHDHPHHHKSGSGCAFGCEHD